MLHDASSNAGYNFWIQLHLDLFTMKHSMSRYASDKYGVNNLHGHVKEGVLVCDAEGAIDSFELRVQSCSGLVCQK